MPFPALLQWLLLAIGVLCLAGGLRRWRIGGKSQVLVGAFCLMQFVSRSENVWLRYPAMTLLSVFGFWVLVKLFWEHDRMSLWIYLPFLLMAFVVSATEVLFDDLHWWQAAVMLAIAVLTAAATVTVVVRLARRSPAPSVT